MVSVCPANVELRTGLGEVKTEHRSGNLALLYKGLEHGTGFENRQGLVPHAENAICREHIGLEPFGVGRGSTDCLLSSLEGKRQSQKNTFRTLIVDLITSDGNGVRVQITTDCGIVAEQKCERKPDIARRKARIGKVPLVPVASRVTAHSGEEGVAAACVKLHCTPLD